MGIDGKLGEEIAKNYLIGKGYNITATNYRHGHGEVDIIAQDDDKRMLIFFEVKSRSSFDYGEPEDAMTKNKKSFLYRTVNGYMMEHPEFDGYELRLDLICVKFKGRSHDITHHENAF
jgi:putative endonuclease